MSGTEPTQLVNAKSVSISIDKEGNKKFEEIVYDNKSAYKVIIEGAGQNKIFIIKKKGDKKYKEAWNKKITATVIQFTKDSNGKVTPLIGVREKENENFENAYDEEAYSIYIQGSRQDIKISVKEDKDSQKRPVYNGKMGYIQIILGELEPGPEKILWQSKGSWDRNPRELKKGQEDDHLELIKVGDPKAIINGDGTVTVNGKSPRLYIYKKNKDVEFSAEVCVEDDVEIAHLIARSKHQDEPKHTKFGGYYLYADFKDQKLYFKKEETHLKKYTDRIPEPGKPITFEKNKWYPMKISVKNIADEKVQIKGDFNGTRISMVDDGTLVKTHKNGKKEEKGPPFREEGSCCFIRTNAPNNVKYRNVIMRQI